MLYHSILGAPVSSGFGDINLILIYRSIIRSNNPDPTFHTTYGMVYPLPVAWHTRSLWHGWQSPSARSHPSRRGEGNADSPTGIRANAHLF